MEVGLRVVRGKNWKWGDQDGGQGSVGTVIEVGGGQGSKTPKNTVVVIWDSGVKANYRAGHQGADDLRVLDNAATGSRHSTTNCDVCRESGLIGIRWKCEKCVDFDLCHGCYMSGKHDTSHTFTRWDTYLSYGVKVSARSSAQRVQAKGTYTGARVVRGANWTYKNQDGGNDKQGVVQSVGDSSEGSSFRSWVKVKWDAGLTNDYRRGHDGAVDVKYVKAASAESYYVDHLPNLSDYAASVFSTGDRVKLNESQLPASIKPHLAPYIGKVGQVIVNEEDNEINVRFRGEDSAFRLYSSILVKVQTYRKGDVVLISNDIQNVKHLQEGHGGWNEQMRQYLGSKADVLGCDSDGDVKVIVSGRKLIFNPECLTLVSKGSGTDSDDNDNEDSDDNNDDATTNLGAAFLDQFLKALVAEVSKQNVDPSSLVQMAAEGKVDAVKAIIQKYPDKVDMKVKDMTALQVAAHQGHQQVVVALVNAGARVDMVDSNGDSVMHFAALGGHPNILQLLLNHKPGLINSTNNDKRTCLHLAVIQQLPRCTEVLLAHNCDVNIQDEDGDTALHIAIVKPDTTIQDQLINYPKLDAKLKNAKGFNVIHQATLKNNTSALQKLIRKYPAFVNVAKTDGFTALHIAVINGFKTAGEILITQGGANIKKKKVPTATLR